MIPMFWLLVFAPLSMLANWLVVRFDHGSPANSRRWPGLGARVVAAAVAAVLTWWLLDVPGFLAQAAALRVGDFAAARAAESRPIVNLSGAGLLAFGAAEFLTIGVCTAIWPERSKFIWGDSGSITAARPRTTRTFGVAMIAVAVLFAVGAFAALPAK